MTRRRYYDATGWRRETVRTRRRLRSARHRPPHVCHTAGASLGRHGESHSDPFGGPCLFRPKPETDNDPVPA